MKLKLTLVAGGQRDDVLLTTDATATVGDVTERIRLSHPTANIAPSSEPLAFSVNPGTTSERIITADVAIGDSGIRSGDVVALSAAQRSTGRADAPVATLNLVAGPGSPATFPLRHGTNLVGRDRSADVRLSDPLVSKRHAKVNISDMVQVIDDGSANGIVISGQTVDRAVLKPGDVATIGDTTFSVTLHTSSAASTAPTSTSIEFNRSPRLDPHYIGIELKAPSPPKPPQTQRFPIVTLVAPIMMAGMIYAITKNAMSILFVALSPLMMIGAYFETRNANKKSFEQGKAQFRSALVDLSVQLQYAADLEREGRRREHPSATEITQAIQELSPLAWTRRPEHSSFLQFRLGLGTQPSRNSVEMPATNDTLPELWRELTDVVSQFATVTRVPVVADFRSAGNVGVSGPNETATPLMANVIGQMVGLHSPSELIVVGVSGGSPAWSWLKWLPHVGSDFSPLQCEHLAGNTAEANILVAALEDLITSRHEARNANDAAPSPAVLVFVHDDAPIERARLVQIAERGPDVAVFVAWFASSTSRLPAACRVFLEIDPNTGAGRAGFVQGGLAVADLEPESIDLTTTELLARRLAPVLDSGTRTDDQSDLPRSVSFLNLVGPDLAESADAVIDLWRENNALPLTSASPKRHRDNTLRALVGQSSAGPLHLDLRTQGPHALVGGTTGAGKSEFLQSWVLGMAAMHSPSRVTFLFVDYKGGAAFADCVNLPHCVGLVTDLSPHLVRRALTSLNAELRYREHILNDKKVKDLLELEKRNDPDTPPSLVIVVDEFAALVAEVPEFVDGVVNVAQRGRSLGLHLILATQRPAGVIKDNLRANTNLRIALRMADEADSTDVIGIPLAGTFDPSLPGRGVAKTGPGRLASFQSAYVGGRTSNEPPKPSIDLRELRFGVGAIWDEPEEIAPSRRDDDDGPNDIRRVVTTINTAVRQAVIAAPRKPWLPDLAHVYRLEQLPSKRNDQELVFGVVDDPEAQNQPEIAFMPDRDGNMAVYGTGGSGKSTFLRSIAVAAAFSPARGGPCHVYGLDFGSRGLQVLEGLPHVGSVISGDDTERVGRLLRRLKVTLDERAERYSKANAATITEYRLRADRPAEPRIIVLIDGVGSFRTAYEGTALNGLWELFQSLAADGRSAGIHFVVSADRPGAVSSSLSSAIQQRLVLRLASEMDYIMLDAPMDAFTSSTPPGRGFLNGAELQVAVISGDPNIARQAAETARLAASMERASIEPAPPIESLVEIVPLSTLPATVGDLPTLGVWDETLEPIGFPTSGTFLVSGPPLSGRTTTVATMVVSLRAIDHDMKLVYLGQRRSPLEHLTDWTHSAIGPIEIDALALSLIDRLADDDGARWTFVLEGVGELLNTDCDLSLQDLLKAARANDHFVIAEGETSTLTGSWPLLQAVKVSRLGIALQPDQADGDSLFKTSFPRLARADFPQGRGLLVAGGKARRVQVALPE